MKLEGEKKTKKQQQQQMQHFHEEAACLCSLFKLCMVYIKTIKIGK